MIPISILDLAHIVEGSDAGETFSASVRLAQSAETLGYDRIWYAEHHNMTGIASSATSVLIGHVAAQTNSIRLGAGGIMLPNHSPLVIAEQFGTLATLYPDRIDLGLGRAPGGDQETMRALRRNKHAGDNFAGDVRELIGYLDAPDPQQNRAASIRAIPGEGTKVPVWILGSSLSGAKLAADMGLPYAFASHFAPQQLVEAVECYRRYFKPSKFLDKPHFMFACNVFAADTEDEAYFHFSSLQQAFAKMVTGERGPFPKPLENLELPDHVQRHVDTMLAASAVGTKEQVLEELNPFLERLQPDEIIVTSAFYDAEARIRSMELVKDIQGAIVPSVQ